MLGEFSPVDSTSLQWAALVCSEQRWSLVCSRVCPVLIKALYTPFLLSGGC